MRLNPDFVIIKLCTYTYFAGLLNISLNKITLKPLERCNYCNFKLSHSYKSYFFFYCSTECFSCRKDLLNQINIEDFYGHYKKEAGMAPTSVWQLWYIAIIFHYVNDRTPQCILNFVIETEAAAVKYCSFIWKPHYLFGDNDVLTHRRKLFSRVASSI